MTKKQPDQIDAPSRDGAFIHGLTLEGCRWDDKGGALDDSKPKELFCPMPVILVKAVTVGGLCVVVCVMGGGGGVPVPSGAHRS